MGKPGPVCVSSYSPPDHVGQQDPQLSVSEGDHPRLAQHALVLGSSGIVIPDTIVRTNPVRPLDPAVQWQLSQGSAEPECLYTWLLEPRLSESRISLTMWQRELKCLRDGLWSRPDM